jgi:CheY-like chemotaxis protein
VAVPSAALISPSGIPFFLCDPSVRDVGQPSGTKRAAIAKDKDRRKVLVVDDEALIADSVAQILNRNGFEATAKYSGKTAIEYVEVECPDIMISDVIMPQYNGIQLAKAIRAHCPDLRILLFSGNAATLELLDQESHQGESFEVLAKPLHPRQLLDALKS